MHRAPCDACAMMCREDDAPEYQSSNRGLVHVSNVRGGAFNIEPASFTLVMNRFPYPLSREISIGHK